MSKEKHGLDVAHPEYDANAPDWETIRDVVAGQKAVRAKSTRYLPALDTENTKAQASYTERATLYGATSRTMEGYLGAVFRKPPTMTLPANMEPMLTNADGNGTRLDQFIKTLLKDVIELNRAGVLLDLPPVAKANALPYLCYYRAEDIQDWRVGVVEGRERALTFLVLREVADEPDENGFGHVLTPKRRVLRLDVSGTKPVYTAEVWAKSKDEWIIEVPAAPVLIRGNPQTRIPFWFFSNADMLPDVKKSCILDLANTNISHYQNTADLEHGAHYTALPTPWISGFNDDSKPDSVPLGPTECIILPLEGEAGMLEFSGAGLKALEARLNAKERHMAILGARILEADKNGVESAETSKLRQTADKSILAAIVGTCSVGLTNVMEAAYEWATATKAAKDAIAIKINDEFFEVALTGQDVIHLVQGWQSGGYSRDSMLRKLQKGGVIERTPEEEIEQMEEEGPLVEPGDVAAQALEKGDQEIDASKAATDNLRNPPKDDNKDE